MANVLESDEEIVGEQQEEVSDEDVVYQINTFGADFTVDGLVRRFDKGNIFRPKFQRNFVWTLPQASKFIESILLGLPIPSIFLYREDETQKHLIVDGLQRLTTLHSYYKGRLPESDRVFRLEKVKKQYDKKSFDELEAEDQRRFEDAVIHAMIIQQLAPNDNNSSVYHIFDRLNSNGTPLQAQEMRAAIYHGEYQNLIGTLNKNPDWRAIFGRKHKRSKDQELILRFLALKHNRATYKKPMAAFLNRFMEQNRHADTQLLKEHGREFEDAIRRVRNALGDRAFRPQRSLNVAVFDSFLVAVAEIPEASKEEISFAYYKLLDNPDYIKWTSEATSDETSVENRISIGLTALQDAT